MRVATISGYYNQSPKNDKEVNFGQVVGPFRKIVENEIKTASNKTLADIYKSLLEVADNLSMGLDISVKSSKAGKEFPQIIQQEHIIHFRKQEAVLHAQETCQKLIDVVTTKLQRVLKRYNHISVKASKKQSEKSPKATTYSYPVSLTRIQAQVEKREGHLNASRKPNDYSFCHQYPVTYSASISTSINQPWGQPDIGLQRILYTEALPDSLKVAMLKQPQKMKKNSIASRLLDIIDIVQKSKTEAKK